MFLSSVVRGAARLLAAIVILLGATLPADAQRVEPSADSDAADLVWPLPPEAPRVRYVGELRSQQNIGKARTSFLTRVKRLLVGSDPKDAQAVNRPFDMHTDGQGRVYVSNGSLGSIFVFDPEARETRILRPTGSASLAKPMGLDGDAAGLLYVADPVRRRVIAMTASGEFVQAYGGRDLLLNPTDVAVSPDRERVYVADSYLHQVVIFDRSSGALIRRVGRNEGDLAAKTAGKRGGSAEHNTTPTAVSNAHGGEPSDLVTNRGVNPGEFRYPAFIDVGPDGTVYVSDGLNFRIQALDVDGNHLLTFGGLGDTPGSFARPKGVGVDKNGHIYVVDAAFNNVQVFDRDGRLLLAFGELGSNRGQLWIPLGITIDDSGRLYVADRYNNRIQVFELIASAERDSDSE